MKITQVIAFTLTAICANTVVHATFDFSYGYKTVLDANANQYIVSAQNVSKYNEGTPGASYWAPSATNVTGFLTSRFDFSAPTTEIFLNAQLASYNFGGGSSGSGSIWASTNGVAWTLLLDNPTPSSIASYEYYTQDVPASLLGTTSFYLQERLYSQGSTIYGQFLHFGQGNSFNGFELDANEAPEPSSLALCVSAGVWALSLRRRFRR